MSKSKTSISHPAQARFAPSANATGFINAAYMTPKPLVAIDAMRDRLERYARPNFAIEDFFGAPERVRALLGKLVGGDAEQFSLTGSASFGLSTLAWNLRTHAQAIVGNKRRILGVNGQFPSNVQVWRRLESAGFEFHLVEGGPGASERLLEAADSNTALIAIAPLSWTDGRRLDLGEISIRAKELGALLALDVTQSIGADGPIPSDLHCDLVVGAGYKWLLGPYGTGFMRLSAELQNQFEPLEANWKNFAGSDDFNALNEYRPEYKSPGAAFDHGESSAFVRMAGFEAGLQCLIEIGPREISAHCREFALALSAELDTDRFEVSDVSSTSQASHIFRVAPRDASQFAPLSQALADAGLSVSQRDGGWRLSPHVYNDGSDIDRMTTVLA